MIKKTISNKHTVNNSIRYEMYTRRKIFCVSEEKDEAAFKDYKIVDRRLI